MNLRKMLPWRLRRYLKQARADAGRVPTTVREQEQAQALARRNYAYGLLRAADISRYFGCRKTTVCEFGVARGDGLLNMIDLAEKIASETEVEFRICGFDTSHGMPEIRGYKDHPEIWSAGDYPMLNRDELTAKISGRAELILGDIKDTVGAFVASLDPTSPLGFISVDVDIYSSSRDALTCLLGPPELYTPAVSIYLDDIAHFFANRWCGELAAVEEFNAEHQWRKIDVDRSERHHDRWFQKMYVCHVLDHPARQSPDRNRVVKLKAGGNLPDGVLN